MQVMQVVDSVQEVGAAVFQEVFALALFGAAFLFFKILNASRVPSKGLKQAKHVEPSPKYGSATPPGLERSPRGTRGSQCIGQPRVQAAEVQIVSLLERREFTSALSTYRAIEREGLDHLFVSEAMFSNFIESAVRVGKLDVVERMLRMMIRNSVPPSLDVWQTTLKMLASRKHYATCLQVYRTHGHMLPNDKVIFSCLINAALEGGMPESVPSMLKRYQQCDLLVADYVTAFRAFVATGSAQLAETLFLELGEKSTTLMLNLVLLTCINVKQPKRAMSLLLKAHDFEAAAEPVQIVDTISYNTVIKGFVASNDVESCWQCLQSMRKHGLEADDVTLTSLLEISLTDETGGTTDRLVQMLMESRQDQALEAVTCNVFIKGLIRAEHLQKAVQVYEALKKSGGSPTIVTYSMLIKASVDALDMEHALLIVKEMVAAGMAPDEIILTHLLEGCRLVGNHKLGEALFDDMLASGVQPSEYTLTMMVKLHGRHGAHDKARKLVETWEAKHGRKPSVIHYTCLMSGCLRGKAHDQAWAAYQLMEKHGVSPDEVMMTTLLPAMVAAQAFDRVLHLTRRALRRPGGIRVANATLNSALSQMSLDPGAAREAEEMRLLMQNAGLEVVTRGNMRRNAEHAPWRSKPEQGSRY